MSHSQQQTPSDPIQQVAELLERSRRILQTTGADPGRTEARTRRMPLDQLQRDPALWAAYIRGWEDRTADVHRSLRQTQPSVNRHTPVPPLRPPMSTTPAAHTTPVQPVRQAYAPQNTPLSTCQTSRTTSTSAKQQQSAPTASGLTRRQQKDKARLRKYMASKRAKTTQQHRLNNKLDAHSTPPATSLPPPTFRDEMVVDGQPPVSSATTGQATDTPIPSTVDTTPEEMEISPEEENEVLRDKTPEYLGRDDNDHDTTWWSTTSAESSPKKKE